MDTSGTQRTKRRMSPDLQTTIEHRLAMGNTPTDVREYLERQNSYRTTLPSIKTISRMRQELMPKGDATSDDWDLFDEGRSVEDARTLLRVLGAVVDQSGGKKTGFANEEADWIIKITDRAPTLVSRAPTLAWVLACACWLDIGGVDRQPVDMMLALAPWKSQAKQERYMDMLRKGAIPKAPQLWIGIMDILVDEGGE